MHLWLIQFIGVIVPRRLRADWRQEWQAELRYREALLADWHKLNWQSKLDLIWRSLGAFWDALLLQPQRLEDEMFQDLKFAVRMLIKNPGFTAVIVLTLGLGIGVNVALFSVVNGVLLNPLPYPQAEQLVTIHQSKPNFETGAMPYPNFRDLQKENETFSAMALSRRYSFSLLGTGEAERVSAQFVTADFFSMLGVEPALGRTFVAGEDEKGAAPVVLISDELWKRKFNAAADVVGQGLTLDDKSYTIIGVLAADFTLEVNLFSTSDVYVPIGQWGHPGLQNRGAALWLHGIGRLKPGVTIEQAEADLNRVMQALAVAYPATNAGNGARLRPLKQRMVGSIGRILWLLLGAVGFVLLIACVNVSNLLLARSTSRTREFAIRSAIGASQGRLLRQSLTESTLLALTGGGLGLLIAGWGTKAALSVLPTVLPRAKEIGLDGRVLLFTVTVSLLAGILAGLAPAVKTSQGRLAETLKEGGRGASRGRVRAQGVMVAIEMALALVLLVGAGLMIRSLNALWNVDTGFRAENMLTFGLNLPPSLRTAKPEAIRSTARELSDQLSALPGVKAASFSIGALPLLSEDDVYFWIEGRPKPENQSDMPMALLYRVEPDYLTAMGIALKQGRFFTPQDDERAQPVAVIDEVFASKHFGNENPIGQRVRFDDEQPPMQIVGVVAHVKQWSLTDESQELQTQLYIPFQGLPDNMMRGVAAGVNVVVRSEGEDPKLLESIHRLVQNQNSQNIISRPQSMNEVIADSMARRRFSMTLLNAFAVVALLMASIGLYGVISYLVGQRTNEIGIRMALGAGRLDVLRLILGHGMKMALFGVGLGLVAALGLTRLMDKMLYGVSPTDPATFAGIALLLTTVALMACYLPARRASKVDPLTALRHE